MAEEFNPYHKWLGIAVQEQPPDHYQLLGVPLFESDLEVIANAADRQMAHVRSFASGKHAEASQRLLNEIAAARVCLLNETKKQAYDRALRETAKAKQPSRGVLAAGSANRPARTLPVARPLSLDAAAPAETPAAPPPRGQAALPQIAAPSPDDQRLERYTARRRSRWIPAAAVGAVAVTAAVVAVILMSSGAGDSDEPAPSDRASAQIAAGGPGSAATAPGHDAGPSASSPPPTPSEPSPPANPPAADPAASARPAPEDPSSPAVPPAEPQPQPRPTPMPEPVPESTGGTVETLPRRPATTETPPEEPAQQRLAIPDETERRQKQAEIDEVFGDQLRAARKPEEQGTLAETLLKYGRESTDTTERYVLLRQTIELATAAGRIDLASAAVDLLSAEYDVPAAEEKSALVQALSRRMRFPEQRRELAHWAMIVSDEAADAERFDLADEVLRAAQSLLSSLRSETELRQQLMARRDGMKQRRAEFEILQAAREALRESPENPEANLTLGKHLCIQKNDWAAGLEHLCKAGRAELAAAAQRDLDEPQEAAEQIQLADAWWAVSEAEKDRAFKTALELRSAHWYRRALPALSALERARVEQRLADIDDIPTEPRIASVRREATGTLYACGDDQFELMLNGKKIAAGVGKPIEVPLKLRLGDVLAAKMSNASYERGLLVLFLSADKRCVVFTSVQTWRSYVPADADRWWDVRPSEQHPAAAPGHPNYLLIPQADGWGAEPIWGQDPAVAYVYHVVSTKDLTEVLPQPRLAAGDKRRVRGTLTAAGDDTYDLALNGMPLLGGRAKAASVPVTLQAGDVLAVKLGNASYEHGFMMLFRSEDRQAALFTERHTWRSYQPETPERWFAVKPSPQDKPALGAYQSSPDAGHRGVGSRSHLGPIESGLLVPGGHAARPGRCARAVCRADHDRSSGRSRHAARAGRRRGERGGQRRPGPHRVRTTEVARVAGGRRYPFVQARQRQLRRRVHGLLRVGRSKDQVLHAGGARLAAVFARVAPVMVARETGAGASAGPRRWDRSDDRRGAGAADSGVVGRRERIVSLPRHHQAGLATGPLASRYGVRRAALLQRGCRRR